MKVAILAGGLGTRLAEETDVKPKPMVDIDGQPILWHIMKYYASFGFDEFVLALGYKGAAIKRYFMEYYQLSCNLSIDLSGGAIQTHGPHSDRWRVHLIDTGINTNTGGRLLQLESWLGDGAFMLTYGDGVSNVDLSSLVRFHEAHGRLATVTAVRPPSRFGGLSFQGDKVAEFIEKPQIGEGWINGGFLVFEPGIFRYLNDASSSLESDALENLAQDGELMAYRHEGFWQSMDTLRDVRLLKRLWESGTAPWKIW